LARKPFKPKAAKGPEAKIQIEIIKYLRNLEWYVLVTHGNAYQVGLPDLFCCHYTYGHRWIDVKNPSNYKFTPAQMETWPKLCANGSGVWILTAANEREYSKLFCPANWWTYTQAWTQHEPLNKDETGQQS